MQKRDLLPGVTTAGLEPKVVCDSRAVIARARRRALLRDVAQLLLVAAVDFLFVYWPSTQIPLFGRQMSVTIVLAFNAAVAFHFYTTRRYPQWIARRISRTWCVEERKRFATMLPARGQR